MNKKLYLTVAVLLILCFVLSSCRNETQISFTPTNTVESDLVILQPDLSLPDEYYTSMQQGARVWHSYLNTPYGKYHYVDGFILYSQYGNSKFVKLCTKAECTHTDDDCDAYLGKIDQIVPTNEKTIKLGYYENNIYYVERSKKNGLDWNLIKMNMDGTERQLVKTFATVSLTQGKRCLGFFHSYYYYFVMINAGQEMGSKYNTDNNFYRVKLDDYSEYESVISHDVIPKACMFTLVGDNVFFYVRTGPYNENYKLYDENPAEYELYMLSLTDKNMRLLTDKWADYRNSHFDWENAYCYKHNDGFYELNLTSEQMNKVADFKIEDAWGSLAYFYPDYNYIIAFAKTSDSRGYPRYFDSQTLYILDKQYHILNSCIIDALKLDTGCFIDDTGTSILLASSANKPINFFIYKSDIGTDDVKLNKITN